MRTELTPAAGPPDRRRAACHPSGMKLLARVAALGVVLTGPAESEAASPPVARPNVLLDRRRRPRLHRSRRAWAARSARPTSTRSPARACCSRTSWSRPPARPRGRCCSPASTRTRRGSARWPAEADAEPEGAARLRRLPVGPRRVRGDAAARRRLPHLHGRQVAPRDGRAAGAPAQGLRAVVRSAAGRRQPFLGRDRDRRKPSARALPGRRPRGRAARGLLLDRALHRQADRA